MRLDRSGKVDLLAFAVRKIGLAERRCGHEFLCHGVPPRVAAAF
jgi:hypothetical protein